MSIDEARSLCLRVHDWFVRHPLGITEEGYDHFAEWFERDLDPFIDDKFYGN